MSTRLSSAEVDFLDDVKASCCAAYQYNISITKHY